MTKNKASTKPDKTRCGGLWTEGRFDSFVTSTLRAGMRRWAPKYEALKKAYVSTKINKKSKRMAKHYKCAICEGHFTSTNIQIDHIVPIGSCRSWNIFIERLFCEIDNLQALCIMCHREKSKRERK